MVRSLGLVLAVVVVVFLIARPSASNSQRVRTVDYGPDVARARPGPAPGTARPLGRAVPGAGPGRAGRRVAVDQLPGGRTGTGDTRTGGAAHRFRDSAGRLRRPGGEQCRDGRVRGGPDQWRGAEEFGRSRRPAVGAASGHRRYSRAGSARE